MPLPISFKRRSNNHSWFYKKDEVHSFPALKKNHSFLVFWFLLSPCIRWLEKQETSFICRVFSGPTSGCPGLPWVSPAPSQDLCRSFRLKLAEDSTRIQIQPVIPNFNFLKNNIKTTIWSYQETKPLSSVLNNLALVFQMLPRFLRKWRVRRSPCWPGLFTLSGQSPSLPSWQASSAMRPGRRPGSLSLPERAWPWGFPRPPAASATQPVCFQLQNLHLYFWPDTEVQRSQLRSKGHNVWGLLGETKNTTRAEYGSSWSSL